MAPNFHELTKFFQINVAQVASPSVRKVHMQYHSYMQQVAATGCTRSRIHRSNGRRTLRARRVSF